MTTAECGYANRRIFLLLHGSGGSKKESKVEEEGGDNETDEGSGFGIPER